EARGEVRVARRSLDLQRRHRPIHLDPQLQVDLLHRQRAFALLVAPPTLGHRPRHLLEPPHEPTARFALDRTCVLRAPAGLALEQLARGRRLERDTLTLRRARGARARVARRVRERAIAVLPDAQTRVCHRTLLTLVCLAAGAAAATPARVDATRLLWRD